ncbi:hypothetical protein FPV67DRAFT_1487415 [Lyophyllum atratum]|nr:hypothetical protein FPV67DRAFT_1487415 [Lyophyllum atratum]
MRPTLVTPRPSIFWTSSRERPKLPPIIIPPTPINTCKASLPPYYKDIPAAQCTLSSTVTPPTSPSLSSSICSTPPLEPDTMSKSALAAPSDLVTIAELFATLKQSVDTLRTTFDNLGTQTERMAHLAPAMKADQQVEDLRAKLEDQIGRQEKSMQEIRHLLEDTIKDSVVQHLKSQIYDAVQKAIAKEVQQRVQQELASQIPENLRRHVQGHQREILEVRTNLCNSEARRHNASLSSPSMTTEPLRPLLRPLPSALQSPAYVVNQPFTANHSTAASPMTAFPGVPAPTPIVSTASACMVPFGTNQVFELVPPTPSPLFPRDLKSLFALGPDKARRLLQDYGLDSAVSAVPSPSSGRPRMKASKTGLNTPEDSPTFESPASREHDLNKFMAHIGVPFLMIPAPKPKGAHGLISPSLIQDQSAPLIISIRNRLI